MKDNTWPPALSEHEVLLHHHRPSRRAFWLFITGFGLFALVKVAAFALAAYAVGIVTPWVFFPLLFLVFTFIVLRFTFSRMEAVLTTEALYLRRRAIPLAEIVTVAAKGTSVRVKTRNHSRLSKGWPLMLADNPKGLAKRVQQAAGLEPAP